MNQRWEKRENNKAMKRRRKKNKERNRVNTIMGA